MVLTYGFLVTLTGRVGILAEARVSGGRWGTSRTALIPGHVFDLGVLGAVERPKGARWRSPPWALGCAGRILCGGGVP